jgi:hypothetical protein
VIRDQERNGNKKKIKEKVGKERDTCHLYLKNLTGKADFLLNRRRRHYPKACMCYFDWSNTFSAEKIATIIASRLVYGRVITWEVAYQIVLLFATIWHAK